MRSTHMKRKPVQNVRADANRFKNTATKTHPVNVKRTPMRGGIRF